MPTDIVLLVMFNQVVNALTNAWNGSRGRRQQWEQHSENIGFQRERFEREKEHQRGLEEMRRETQLQQAGERLRETTKTREVHKLYESWPLKLVPSQYLSGGRGGGRVPLKVLVAPPEGKRISGHQLEQGLRTFVEKNYSLHDPTRPVEFLGGAWDNRQLRSEVSIKILFSMLKSAPTLVLESLFIEDDLHLYVGYWGIGQEEYCFQHVATIPYHHLLADKARAAALEWRAIEEGLRGHGVGPEEARRYGGADAENLKVYEEEERLRGLLGADAAKLNFQQKYSFDTHHYTAACGVVASFHCLLTGCIVDVYHLLHHGVPPLLPRLLPELTADLPEAQVAPLLNNLADSYSAAYEVLEVDRPVLAPEFSLDLAQSLAALPDKGWAERHVERSMRMWLRLRNAPEVGAEELMPLLKRLLTPDDRTYATKLRHLLLAIGHHARAEQLDAVC